MRLLLITPGFPIGPGDYTPGITDTLRLLSQRHTLQILSVCAPPPRGHHRWGQVPVFSAGAGAGPLRKAQRLFALLQRATQSRFDLIWAIWPDRTGPLAQVLSRRLGAPMVQSLMGGELADLPALSYGGARSRRGALKLRLSLSGAALVTAGSEPLKRKLQAWGVRAACCPLGVPVRSIAPRSGAKAGPPRVLMVSDLSPIKRVALALAGFARFLKIEPQAKLTIFGLPRGRSEHTQRLLQELEIERAVTLGGFIEPARLRERYAEHDAFLHTSAHESQGMALIEAASAALPIASFEVGVFNELRALGAPGARITDDSPEAVCAALEQALPLKAPEQLQQTLNLQFGVEACAARFEAHFASLNART